MATEPTKRPLTTAEKLTLISGKDFWTSEALPDAGVPAIRMSDGPHGLRYQETAGDHLGINDSTKATAFPTASASAASFDPALLREMGAAIAKEARSLGVDVVLGPGVNIKRNPLAGRNFEYFSEDPFLAGTLGTAWIDGLQANGVGASLKHYAGNNQETARLLSDSLIDPIALHELYLEAFRLAVTQTQPATVMVAYNQVNGTYMSEHDYLLDTVLRGQWGFNGAVVTDWGALNDPVKSVNAGTDLEMPGDGHFFGPDLEAAVASGAVDPAALDRAAAKLTALATTKRPAFTGDRDALLGENGELARRIAEASAVLLENQANELPLNGAESVALIGELAVDTRYQGAGSSHINAVKTSSIRGGLAQAGVALTYAQGYRLDGDGTVDAKLQAEAVAAAKAADRVIVVVGLPEAAESEGMDRPDMALPAAQNALVAALVKANAHVTGLLIAGAPVELPWRKDVQALLSLALGGQAVGAAAANLLLGNVNPSGRLAETYPIQYADVPSSALFGHQPRSVPYVESLYVGYRYYDKAAVPVAYPFGYGLSYTTFTYTDAAISDAQLNAGTAELTVSVTVTNTGAVPGATVVQAYVGQTETRRLAPLKTLQGFQKVAVEPGESARVTITLPAHAFMHWHEDAQAWQLATERHRITLGTSSVDAIATFEVTSHAPTNTNGGSETAGATAEQHADVTSAQTAVESATAGSPDHPRLPRVPAHFPVTTANLGQPADVPAWYLAPAGRPSADDFATLSGLRATPVPTWHAGQLTAMNTPRELGRFSVIVRSISSIMLRQQQKQAGNTSGTPEANFMETTILDTPLIRLAQQSSGLLKPWAVRALVGLANQPLRSRFRKER